MVNRGPFFYCPHPPHSRVDPPIPPPRLELLKELGMQGYQTYTLEPWRRVP